MRQIRFLNLPCTRLFCYKGTYRTASSSTPVLLGEEKNEATASQLSVSKDGHFNRTQSSLHSLSARFPGP